MSSTDTLVCRFAYLPSLHGDQLPSSHNDHFHAIEWINEIVYGLLHNSGDNCASNPGSYTNWSTIRQVRSVPVDLTAWSLSQF